MSDTENKIVQLVPAPGWRCYTVGLTSSGGTFWDATDDVVAFALMYDGSVQTLVSDDETSVVTTESLSGPNTWSRLIGPGQEITDDLREQLKSLVQGRFENSEKRFGRVGKNLSPSTKGANKKPISS
jgi:hypothetical protein